MGYGRTSAKGRGSVFSKHSLTTRELLGRASVAIKHLLRILNVAALRVRRSAWSIHNSAYGKEPFRTLERALAKSTGSNFRCCPLTTPVRKQEIPSGCRIRRGKADNVIMFTVGA